MPLNHPWPDYSNAKANAGGSYVSSDGNIWTDITTAYPNTNVCIKGFTDTEILINDSIEIHGPVYNGSNLQTIGNVTMDATKFAAFFYDIDNNVTTESLSISKGTGNVIAENGLVYSTTIGKTEYEFEKWGNYSVLGFFADKYIPIKANDASKLAKLVLDTDEKYTLKTGEKLDLGSGYALEAKQVDVDGAKVWLEFTKDGTYVDDQII